MSRVHNTSMRVVFGIALAVLPAACVSAPAAVPGAAITPSDSVEVATEPRAGWFIAPDGARVLVSPGPSGGYRRLDFERADFGALNVGDGGHRWTDGSGDAELISPEGERWTRWAGAPYDVEEVVFESRDGVELGGVLLTPRDPVGRGAAVIHGSGSSDRDNVWAYTFAHALARSGLHVIFPDKRGSGASGGEWETASFDVLAGDAVAAAGELASRSGLDPGDIGFAGLSQGGWIAPLAARFMGDAAFVASVSSAAVPVHEQIGFEVANSFRGEEHSAADLTAATALHAAVVEYATGRIAWEEYLAVRSRTLETNAAGFAEALPTTRDDPRWAWLAAVGPYDPIESWALAPADVLVLYGEEDEADNVPVQRSVEGLERLARRPGQGPDRVQWEVYPGLGHALISEAVGWVAPAALARLIRFAGGRPAPPQPPSAGRS